MDQIMLDRKKLTSFNKRDRYNVKVKTFTNTILEKTFTVGDYVSVRTLCRNKDTRMLEYRNIVSPISHIFVEKEDGETFYAIYLAEEYGTFPGYKIGEYLPFEEFIEQSKEKYFNLVHKYNPKNFYFIGEISEKLQILWCFVWSVLLALVVFSKESLELNLIRVISYSIISVLCASLGLYLLLTNIRRKSNENHY